MAELPNTPKIHRGLKDVYFERSPTTFIDGKAGELRYRGYSIHDLAQHSTFEETTYLLLHGKLPSGAELSAFQQRLAEARQLPDAVVKLIGDMRHGHPMDVLRTAASALAGFDPDRVNNDSEAMRRKGLRLTSQIPMIVAMHEALRNKRAPVAPEPSLGHAANFLWQLTGKVPSAHSAKLLDKDLILHAEYGSNASSFAARVVIGTEAARYW